MAIAFDAASARQDTAGVSTSFAFTTSGADRILFVGVWVGTNTDIITGVTYNGVAMTLVATIQSTVNSRAYLWALANPASGSNTVSVPRTDSVGSAQVRAISYTGAFQSSTVDNSTTVNTTSGTTETLTLTPVATNCWAVAFFRQDVTNTPTAGAGTTLRGLSGDGLSICGDSNGVISGSTSLILNAGGTITQGPAVMASFAPSGAVAATGSMFEVF